MTSILNTFTAKQIERARWVQLAPTTKALQAQQRDGGKVLAVVQNVAFMRSQCPWRTVNGATGIGYLPVNAMVAARKALLEAVQVAK